MLSDLLLDISTDKFSHFELEESFDKVAIELLRNTKLISGKNQYVIKEIEFYFVSDHYRHLESQAFALFCIVSDRLSVLMNIGFTKVITIMIYLG